MRLNTKKITKSIKEYNLIKELAVEAFPKGEYLSPNALIKMSKEGNFDFLALYDDDIFIGFIAINLYKNISYLFFLAILKEFRSKGYGTRAIETIKELYPNYLHVVDFEVIDKNAPNYEQRIKRKKFYLKNGYKETYKGICCFDIDYEILCMEEYFDFSLFKEMMNSIGLIKQNLPILH